MNCLKELVYRLRGEYTTEKRECRRIVFVNAVEA